MARLACCVPFCRRTTGRTEFVEWICGKHWPLIDHRYRRVYGRAARRWRRYRVGGERAARLWRRIKRQAIERAAGIT
jgi:hypothetical protein